MRLGEADGSVGGMVEPTWTASGSFFTSLGITWSTFVQCWGRNCTMKSSNCADKLTA